MSDRLERSGGAWGIAHRQLIWDWNHDAPAAEHWMQGLLAPDEAVLRVSGKFPADPSTPPADPADAPPAPQPVRSEAEFSRRDPPASPAPRLPPWLSHSICCSV